jgi:hypothetical protein
VADSKVKKIFLSLFDIFTMGQNYEFLTKKFCFKIPYFTNLIQKR